MRAGRAGTLVLLLSLMRVSRAFALDPDVLLALPFDEGKGDSVTSLALGGVEGTIVGSDSWVDGKRGTAVELDPDDGETDFVRMDDEALFDLEIDDSFTFAAWVNLEAKGAGDHFIIAKEENQGNYRGPYLLVYPAGSVPGMLLTSTTNNQLWTSGKTPVIDGDWHHIAGSHDGTVGGTPDAIRIWVDGKPDEVNVTRDDLNEGSILNDTPVTIGCRDVGGVPAKGAIDEVVIVKRVLTDHEVASLAEDGLERFLAVNPQRRLALMWGDLKSESP